MADAYEDKNVVYKRGYTDKIRRTVVAFANTNGGKIYVGIDDFGQVVGLNDVDDVKRRVSKLLQDGIFPDVTPYVEYTVEYAEGKKLVGVEVSRGSQRPYWLADRGLEPDGTLVRRDTASAPASFKEIGQMIQETSEGPYEEFRTLKQNLSFEEAAGVFRKHNIKLDRLELRTLGLVDGAGAYTNLALLLSDQCPTTIKLAFLAENEHRVDEVVELSGSLFRQYADTFEKLDRHNRKFIKTLAGRAVDDKEYREYPVMSIREALANAVVHRDYSLSTPTLVRVSHDRIEIVSTGGLAPGVSKEELFLGVSVCRNPKLARVFNKIRVVDSFGLGLARIREGYQNTAVEPSFEIGFNFFKITLFNTFERRSKPRTKEEQPVELRIAKLDPVELSVAPSVDELTNATNAEAPNYDGSLSVAAKNLTSPDATVRRKQLEDVSRDT